MLAKEHVGTATIVVVHYPVPFLVVVFPLDTSSPPPPPPPPKRIGMKKEGAPSFHSKIHHGFHSLQKKNGTSVSVWSWFCRRLSLLGLFSPSVVLAILLDNQKSRCYGATVGVVAIASRQFGHLLPPMFAIVPRAHDQTNTKPIRDQIDAHTIPLGGTRWYCVYGHHQTWPWNRSNK